MGAKRKTVRISVKISELNCDYRQAQRLIAVIGKRCYNVIDFALAK
jgi:hypothetical protein